MLDKTIENLRNDLNSLSLKVHEFGDALREIQGQSTISLGTLKSNLQSAKNLLHLASQLHAECERLGSDVQSSS